MIQILLNPTAGRGRARRLEPCLRSAADALSLPLLVTDSAADLVDRARAAVSAGAERVVVAGGDGSIHRVLPVLAGTGTALGVVPIGRGNDLARDLGLPADPLEALRRAVSGPLRRIDLGTAAGRPFACIGGVGLDGEVAARVNRRVGPPGPWAYPYAVVSAVATFRAPQVEVAWEGGRWAGRALFVLGANASQFGGGMRIAPHARLDDGVLDVVIAREVSALRLLGVFPRVYRGTHLSHPAVVSARSPWVEIRGDRPLPVYADGEEAVPAGTGPVRLEARPGALLVAGDIPVFPPKSKE